VRVRSRSILRHSPGWAQRQIQQARTWIDQRQRPLTVSLVAAAIVLRILLVAFSPTPFGYVWDFYHEGIQVLYKEGRLPVAADCWQCYHPPLFYVAGWPFYALGRLTGSEAVALRMTGALSMLSAMVTIAYGYRLLRLYRCRGTSLMLGTAVLLIFPCLFISSYGIESDIVLTAILSAFVYYLTVYAARPSAATLGDAVRLGALAGLAAATKYSGLTGVITMGLALGWQVLRGRHRARRIQREAQRTARRLGP